MEIAQLYAAAVRDADKLIESLGVRDELVQNDTLCLQVSSNDRYTRRKQDLALAGTWISESLVNGRLIAVLQLHEPLRAHGWSVSFIELPQPKTGSEIDGIRHLQFVTRTGIESFRHRFAELGFRETGNPRNRLLEITENDVVVRFHDKNLGAVIEWEQVG
ncbi:VOC family protein [Nesterenkonia sp. CF4.4]|uniref:VOC family protein n=1 Tax=Nesterenkonia sp. CF4.4 TaxID=3373079 RepID=UPI003EE5AA04